VNHPDAPSVSRPLPESVGEFHEGISAPCPDRHPLGLGVTQKLNTPGNHESIVDEGTGLLLESVAEIVMFSASTSPSANDHPLEGVGESKVMVVVEGPAFPIASPILA